jgi:membrane protease YdiL (CAAX protease family)
LLVVLFGYLLHQSESVALISLGVCFMFISDWIRKTSLTELQQIFAFSKPHWSWMSYGVFIGIGLSMVLRWNQTHTLYPWPLRPFLTMAVMIGITEELLFRGYFLGRLLSWQHPAIGITISALLHAAYKVAIFVSPSPADDLLVLGTVTFSAGLLLGYWRKASGSIWPCIVFHALFDLWVYGDRATPWWVW